MAKAVTALPATHLGLIGSFHDKFASVDIERGRLIKVTEPPGLMSKGLAVPEGPAAGPQHPKREEKSPGAKNTIPVSGHN